MILSKLAVTERVSQITRRRFGHSMWIELATPPPPLLLGSCWVRSVGSLSKRIAPREITKPSKTNAWGYERAWSLVGIFEVFRQDSKFLSGPSWSPSITFKHQGIFQVENSVPKQTCPSQPAQLQDGKPERRRAFDLWLHISDLIKLGMLKSPKQNGRPHKCRIGFCSVLRYRNVTEKALIESVSYESDLAVNSSIQSRALIRPLLKLSLELVTPFQLLVILRLLNKLEYMKVRCAALSFRLKSKSIMSASQQFKYRHSK